MFDELNMNKKLIRTFDITGREISSETKQNISFQLFDNGSVKKNYLIK